MERKLTLLNQIEREKKERMNKVSALWRSRVVAVSQILALMIMFPISIQFERDPIILWIVVWQGLLIELR